MNFLALAKRFQKDEDGAVTVDWVVLTAAVVGLGLLVISLVQPAIRNAGNIIATDINNAATTGRNLATP